MRFILLLLPWLELATLIQLGIETSALTALAYVFGTFVLGLLVIQRQGMGMFQRLREAQHGQVLGTRLLVDDMAVGLAGLLLLVPGMITDFAAVIVLIGPLRRKIQRFFAGEQPEVYRSERDSDSHVTIEGSYRRVDD
ncbi:FxsA family protein [Parahaliea sp. F7430]|uniref:FxsA family protein n=1 Tax=Sediminihaliea albiluteola TaxID=2758564 RepID=A0A7W2TYH0_9GAMM|nr:FxsA family protein [Sediminihaliea albiluteola]MBA6414295.1 FxsA family protein [Sediminihaliea albiluteola]